MPSVIAGDRSAWPGSPRSTTTGARCGIRQQARAVGHADVRVPFRAAICGAQKAETLSSGSSTRLMRLDSALAEDAGHEVELALGGLTA